MIGVLIVLQQMIALAKAASDLLPASAQGFTDFIGIISVINFDIETVCLLIFHVCCSSSSPHRSLLFLRSSSLVVL
jgi:hypothetical protein